MSAARRFARYDPRRQSKAANLSTGCEVSADNDEPKTANVSAGSNAAHGPLGLAAPYREQIQAGLRQGLTAQRIWQDLCADLALLYPHSYARRSISSDAADSDATRLARLQRTRPLSRLPAQGRPSLCAPR